MRAGCRRSACKTRKRLKTKKNRLSVWSERSGHLLPAFLSSHQIKLPEDMEGTSVGAWVTVAPASQRQRWRWGSSTQDWFAARKVDRISPLLTPSVGISGVCGHLRLFRPHLNSDSQAAYGLNYFLSPVYGIIISNNKTTLRMGNFVRWLGIR